MKTKVFKPGAICAAVILLVLFTKQINILVNSAKQNLHQG